MWHSTLWRHLQAKLQETAVDLVIEDTQLALTGAALSVMVHRIAMLLQPHIQASVRPDTPPLIGLYLSNSALYVATVLATLRFGAAFIPLDPRWPVSRLQQALGETQPRAVCWAQPTMAGGHGEPLVQLGGPPCLVQLSVELCDPKCFTEAAEGPAGRSVGESRCSSTPASQSPGSAAAPWYGPAGGSDGAAASGQLSQPLPYCYVLYTSGSTGAPMGVCGTEEGVLNRCDWMQLAYPFCPGDRVAFRTSPCFVDSIWEIFGPLLAGAPLIAVPQAFSTTPQQLLGLCAARKVTHLTAVPTLWRGLTACLESSPGLRTGLALRLVVSSGEPLPPSLLGRMQALLPRDTTILNLYGSTEVAADCTAFDCTSWQPDSPGRGSAAAARCDVAAGSAVEPDHGIVAAHVPVGTPLPGMWVGVLTSKADADLGSLQPHFQSATEGDTLDPGLGLHYKMASEADATGSGEAISGRQVGEVVVGGVGLAVGYLHQPAATARRFVEVPATSLSPGRFLGCRIVIGPAQEEPLQQELRQQGGSSAAVTATRAAAGAGAQSAAAGGGGAAGLAAGWVDAPCSTVRVFRTGDLGYVDAAGQLRLCGRRDLQVKIGGVRLDLSEVEAALSRHPAVHAAAAKLWDLQAGPALAAYTELVPQARPPIAPQDFWDWCQQRLPQPAVPAAVVVLPRPPRSSGGKLQRAALPLPQGWQQALQQEQKEQRPMQDGQACWAAEVVPAPPGEVNGRAAKRARQQQQQQDDSIQAGSLEKATGAVQQEPQPARQLGQSHQRPALATGKPPTEVDVSRVFTAALQAFLPQLPPRPEQPQQPPLFEPTTNIFHLGANSLVVGAIADGLAIPAELVYEAPTVRGLAARTRAAHQGQQTQLSPARHAAAGWAGAEARQLPSPVARSAGPLQSLQAAARPLGQSLGGADLRAGTAGCLAGEGRGTSIIGQPVWCGNLLQLAWRAPMLQCVDAPPLAALLPADTTAADGELGIQQVFACSHGGDVRCFDGSSGRQLWETVLPDRADVGLALCYPAKALAALPGQQAQGSGASVEVCTTAAEAAAGKHPGSDSSPCLGVATNGGTVFFLDAVSGHMRGSVEAGGGLRAAPVVDPWAELVWVASHAKELLVLQAPGRVVARHPCSASVSAQVTFCESLRMAFVACLDGTLQALGVALEELPKCQVASTTGEVSAGKFVAEAQATAAAAGAAGTAGAGTASGEASFPAATRGHSFLKVAWQHQADSPLFTAPLVIEPCLEEEAGPPLVIAAAVDGSVTAVEAGTGRKVWQCQLGSPIFTPLVQLIIESAAAGTSPAAVASARSGHGGDDCSGGARRADTLSHGTALRAVLVGTQAGDVHALAASSGSALARVPMGDKITGISSLSAGLHPQALAADSDPAASAAGSPLPTHTSNQGCSWEPPLVLVCTQSGLLCLLAAGELVAGVSALARPGIGCKDSVLSGGVGSCAAQTAETVDKGKAVEHLLATSEAVPGVSLGSCLLDVVQLPAEVFSTPSALPWSTGFVVGCRDDHIYCLQVAKL